MILNGFVTFILMILFPLLSVAAPSSLTYQGRILKQDGSPLEYSNVAFVFQITNPSGSCVVYQEQVSGINMVNSGGVFDVPIGKGTVQYVSAGTTILDAFNNNSTFTCGACTASGNTYTCSAGSSTYGAHADDGRLLRVSFWDGIGWRTINTDNEIRSVPYAAYSLSAQKLGNNIVDDFLLKAGIPTCPSDTFLSWNGTALSCVPVSGAAGGTVTNVTSTNAYLVVANGTSTPALTLNVGTSANSVAAGNDSRIVNAMQTGAVASGDLSGNYPNPKVAALQGVAVSTSAPGTGQFLKYNGTTWASSALSSTDISDLATNYLTQASFNNTISAASCTVSQTMYWNSVAGKFQCQNINVGLAGDVTGSIGAAKVVALQNSAISATAPTSNQVLQWDGSAWTPTSLPAQNPGTITGVTAGTGLTGGGTTGTVTLNVDAGNGPNQIVKLDASSRLPAVDGSQLTNLQASQIPNLSATKITSGVLAVAQGGTGQSSFTDGQILIGNSVGNTLAKSTLTAGSGINITNGNGAITISAGSVSGSQLPAFTGDVTSSAGSTTLTLSNSGATAGTYKSVTVDAKGRVTAGTNPTSLSGYGITDAVQNIGGTPGIQSGADTSKPASPAAGTIYFATDTNKIYQYNSSAWATIASASGSGGTISALTSDVTASGSGSVAATVNSVGGSTAANLHTAELAANAATSANTASTIVKRDASGNFSAGTITASLTGAASLNVLKAGDTMTGHLTHAANIGDIYTAGTGGNTVTLQGPSAAIGTSYVLRLPTAQGATNQLMINDGSGNLSWTNLSSIGVASVAVTSPITNSGTATAPNIAIQQANTSQSGYLSNTDWNTFNTKQSATLNSANIWVGNGSNVAAGVPASGDVTLTNAGAFTVTKLQGYAVSATAPTTGGQVMRWSGSAWTPNFVSMFDLRSTITGTQAFGGVGCTAGQTLTWTAATDNLSCTTIAISGTQVTYASQSANTFFAAPSGGAGTPSFRTIASADLPTNLIVNDGNTLGSAVTVGTNDGNALNLETNNASRMTITSAGNVGIGTSTVGAKFFVQQAADTATDAIQFSNSSKGATTALYIDSSNRTHIGGSSASPNAIVIDNATGNIGINTTVAPIAGGGGRQYVTIKGTSNAGVVELASGAADATNNVAGIIQVTDANNGTGGDARLANIAVVTQGATANNRGGMIQFATRPDGGVGPLTTMAIDSTGAVGIGTVSPANQLHVVGTGNTKIRVEAPTGYDAGFNFAQNGTVQWYMDNENATNRWRLRNNGSTNEWVSVLQNGNVGIGNTSPSTKLHVEDSSTDTSLIGNVGLRIVNADTTTNNYANIKFGTKDLGGTATYGAMIGSQFTSHTTSAINGDFFVTTTLAGTAYERMRITSAGNVGMGTTAPTSTLHINSTKNINSGSNLTNGIGAVRISDGSSISLLMDTNQIEQMDPTNFLYLNYNSAANTIINQGGGKVAIGNVASLTYLLQLGTDSAAKPGTSTWTIASDVRLKDVRGSFTRGLDALEGIHPIYFNYKNDNALGLPSDKEYVGIKAQDALAVVPEAVSQDEQGFYHVTNDAIIWTMMNAVKELYHRWMDDSKNVQRSLASLQEENATLKQKDEEKDAKIKELEQRLEKIERSLNGH